MKRVVEQTLPRFKLLSLSPNEHYVQEKNSPLHDNNDRQFQATSAHELPRPASRMAHYKYVPLVHFTIPLLLIIINITTTLIIVKIIVIIINYLNIQSEHN